MSGGGGESTGKSGGASCPLALKFSLADSEGWGGAKGKEGMFGTLDKENRREFGPDLAIQGLLALEVISLHWHESVNLSFSPKHRSQVGL